MREIKFRGWRGATWNIPNHMTNFTLSQLITEEWCDAKSNFDVIMQYTGLLDKNGNEICEGDICKNYYKGQWVNIVVVWNPLGMWSVKWKDGYLNNYHINNHNMEIIGNIYETPDKL